MPFLFQLLLEFHDQTPVATAATVGDMPVLTAMKQVKFQSQNCLTLGPKAAASMRFLRRGLRRISAW